MYPTNLISTRRTTRSSTTSKNILSSAMGALHSSPASSSSVEVIAIMAEDTVNISNQSVSSSAMDWTSTLDATLEAFTSYKSPLSTEQKATTGFFALKTSPSTELAATIDNATLEATTFEASPLAISSSVAGLSFKKIPLTNTSSNDTSPMEVMSTSAIASPDDSSVTPKILSTSDLSPTANSSLDSTSANSSASTSANSSSKSPTTTPEELSATPNISTADSSTANSCAKSSISTSPSLIVKLKYASPRSSLSPTAADSLMVDISSNQDLPQAAMPVLTPKKSTGAFEYTRADADRLSVPLPGPELTRLVEEAKRNKEIPACHNTAHVRYVDGTYMAPGACEKCASIKKATGCDRNTPSCKTCTKSGTECVPSEKMMPLRTSKNARKSSDAPVEVEDIPQAQVAPPAQLALPAQLAPPNEGKTRKRTARSSVVNYSYNDTTDTEDQVLAPLEEYLAEPKVSKRAKTDAEFRPDRQLTPTDSEDAASILETPVKVTKKSRGNAVKKAVKPAYHVNVQEGKPEPYGKPSAWASTRQALCETLVNCYRAYESAAYTNDGILYGFLTDREVGIRDQFTDQIIITKCGGGKSEDADGKMVMSRSQSDKISATGLAFISARDKQLPIALIAGQGNSASPSKLPHYYNVLDWFHVTDVWFEKVEGVNSLVARMEKINLTEMSWWASKDTILTTPDYVSNKTLTQSCAGCKKPSKVIYEQGFTCLRSECKKFFQFDEDHANLTYNETFLKERTQYLGESMGSIAPPLIELLDVDSGYEKRYKQGIVCPDCQSCIRRIKWLGWECENDGCGYTRPGGQRITSVSEAIQQGRDDQPLPKSICDPSIAWTMATVGFYDIYEYTVPDGEGGVAGWIRHFKSRALINEQPDGPNDLFEQMQTDVFNLKRGPARLAGTVKEVLTAHYGTNWGAPYKYGVAQDSVAFSDAPDIVIKAVKRLTWAGEQALTANDVPFVPFNELLTLGYFQENHIGFHDDGESTLGPTIVSLSLGADATMRFRPKAKSNIGTLRGAQQAVDKKTKRTKPVMLSFTICHGDLLVMHGNKLQKYYEHAVDPHGKLRYALTCRYIDPLTMASDADREHTAVAGKLPEGSEKFDYDGDVNAKPVIKTRTINHAVKLNNSIDALRLAGDITVEEEEALLMQRLEALRQQRSEQK